MIGVSFRWDLLNKMAEVKIIEVKKQFIIRSGKFLLPYWTNCFSGERAAFSLRQSDEFGNMYNEKIRKSDPEMTSQKERLLEAVA